MSYILEALKKSDQERKQGEVPGLQSVHIPVTVDSHSSNRWLYIVIVLLLLSLAFVIGMLRPWSYQPGQDVAIIQTVTPVVVETEVPVKETPETKIIETPQSLVSKEIQPTAVETFKQVEVVKEPTVVIEQTPSLEMDAVPHLSEMPSLVQQAIPDMSFAGHVYSSQVSQRSVIINGHSMSEGDVIINGLKVEQIIQNGVVFNYQGQLFRVDILQDWSFD